MHAVSSQDIFEPVEREVVGELADQDVGDQSGAGDPAEGVAGAIYSEGSFVADR